MFDFNFNIDKEKLTNFLKLYIDKFWGKHWEQEKYKWEAVACFQDNWDIDASDFMKMFVEATKEANPTTGSLINSRRNKSLDDLKNIVKFNDPEEVRNLFKDLYNEELQIEDRIKAFIDGTDELRKKCTNEIKPEYKQKDSVMTYLWLMYPEKYCIYKFSSCVKLSKKIGSNYNPKGGLLDDVLGSIKFFDKIRLIVRDNKEILDILQNCNKEIKFKKLKCEFAQKGAEKWLNTLISDLGYFIGVYDIDVHVDNYSKNIILYGPPGTGKTYNTVLKAMNIIAPEKNYCDSNYNDAKAEYNKLTKDGRIQFVTFHQSYSYEDFIEGIKPKIAKNEGSEQTDSGQVEYEIKDGVFKAFCKKASTPIFDEKKDFSLNPYATVWKVSLEGTGDNTTRRECLDNGHIRIGFDKYGADITDETVFDSAVGGKSVLNSFINKMQIGDIVLSCYSSKTIDAIGIVTGDYEWHNEYDKYKRLRNVNWIVKDIREDITVLNNNTTLTLASVYKLNIPVNDIIILVNKYNSPIKVTKNDLPCVFIIDEINRGNISKIFGELITLIEETKREDRLEETSAILPYSGDSFTVPDNVYIIGTMNTADRSLAVVDTALRRRFSFEEMMPNPNLLYKEVDGKKIDIVIDDINIKELLTVMNDRITALYDREHTIGHAYFMGLKDIEKPTINDLGEIFKFKIIPLLQEYFYEDYEKIRLVLGDNQKKNKESMFIIEEEKTSNSLFGNDNILESDIKFYKLNPEAFGKKEAYDFLQSNKTEENKDSK